MSVTEIRFYGKKAQYGEFSNFYTSPFTIEDKSWETVEHYFQAMKFPDDPEYQEFIRKAKSPPEAKRLGGSRKHPLRPDWNTYRDIVMKRALEAKYTQNSMLKELLLSTGDAYLIEDSPSDYYWGCGQDGTGQNMLGKLLVQVRNELKR